MRALLVDDHTIVRAGLRRLLADEFPGIECGEATTAHEAVEKARAGGWDVVLLDISLAGRSGLEALKDIQVACPTLPVLVMTMHAEHEYAIRAFRNGASGYITKDSEPDELLTAIRKVMSGGRYVTAELAEALAGSLRSDSGRPPHDALSDRELQVLRMLGAGISVKRIGAELSLSEKTISTYRTRMLLKLGLSTTADLIRYAIRHGLVT